MPEHTSLDPAVELAARVLFGDELLAALGPGFVRSLTEQPGAWASALTSVWTISQGHGGNGGGTGTSGAGAVVARPARVAAPAPAPVPSPLVGQASAAVAAPTPVPAATSVAAAPAHAPAPTPVSAPRTPTAQPLSDEPRELDFFDPSTDNTSEPTAETRETPWEYEEVRAEFVKLLEEATGYPAEVLDDDADLEADLAIDSVKQVEALGKLREQYQLLFEEDFSIVDHRTIRSLAGHLTDRLNRERLTPVPAR